MTTGLSEYEFFPARFFAGSKSDQFKELDEELDEEEEEEEEEENSGQDEEGEIEEELDDTLENKDSSIVKRESLIEEDFELLEARRLMTTNNLYQHLSKLLTEIFTMRPKNVVDIFELLSLETKSAETRGSSFHNISPTAIHMALAKIQKKIFTDLEDVEEGDFENEDGEPLVADLMETSYYFEQAGVGLGKEETHKIFLALRKLAKDKGLENARFWGKIYGVEQNYIVVESDYVEGDEEEEEEEAEEEAENEEPEDENDEEEEEVIPVMPLPKNTYKPPPDPPNEEAGEGINRKIYFVCNDPGKLWSRLPPVTPKQIQVARRVCKYFSGRLDAPIISFPPFPGLENNYLRAQIARISAATHVAPQDYYAMNEEEEEEEQSPENLEMDPDFEAPTMREQAEKSLDGWVHQVPYILPQGRLTWWNPNGDEDEEEEEEEEEEEATIIEKKSAVRMLPEVGPPLLTPLSEDSMVDHMVPWTVELSSRLFPDQGVVAVHSNLWPGAHAFFNGEKFENIYIGFGLKHMVTAFSPAMPSTLASEYPPSNDLIEVNDPTVEEEFPPGIEEEEDDEDEEVEEDVEKEDDQDDDAGDDD